MALGRIQSPWRNGFWSMATCRQQCLPRTRGAQSVLPTSSFSTSHSFNDHDIVQKNDVPDPTAVQAATDEADTASQDGDEVVKTNRERNAFMRQAFRKNSSGIRKQVKKTLHKSPYVAPIRQYPSSEARIASGYRAKRDARVQVGVKAIWKSFDQAVPKWWNTFRLLKRMTPTRAESNMVALRILLPSTVQMPLENNQVELVDARTGLATKLRVRTDGIDRSTLVLRGESSVLGKAADDIVRVCPKAEIFKLGDVATCDSKMTRLWPLIENTTEDAADGGINKHSFWVHEDFQRYWIDKPYEETPKPPNWTKESFGAYITTLARGKLHSHLALKYYRQPRDDGDKIDTDGIRVRMMMDAFEDPSARECITLPIFKLALAFMAHRGGHRASAHRLFMFAQKWRLPIDTEAFNIIMGCYVIIKDTLFFHRCLKTMEERGFYPNARTWLLFLRMTEQDDSRQKIISSMQELGLFEDPATRRGVATIMAGYDAHTAFFVGKTMDQFMAEQATRYGDGWFTGGALVEIVKEYLRFHSARSAIECDDFQALLKRRYDDGLPFYFDVGASYAMLGNCLEKKDWKAAIWTLLQLEANGCEPDSFIFTQLASLAIITGASSTLGVIIFYGVVWRKLRHPVRRLIQGVLLRKLNSEYPVKVFSSHMAQLLRDFKVGDEKYALRSVEWAIFKSLDGYKPRQSLASIVKTAWRTMDKPRLMRAHRLRKQKELALELSREQQLQDFQPFAPGLQDFQPFEPELQDPRLLQSWHWLQDLPDEAEDDEPLIGELAIRVHHPSDERPKKVVHLDTAFIPKTMIRGPIHTDGTPENSCHNSLVPEMDDATIGIVRNQPLYKAYLPRSVYKTLMTGHRGPSRRRKITLEDEVHSGHTSAAKEYQPPIREYTTTPRFNPRKAPRPSRVEDPSPSKQV
ncbi:hypothetical protein E4U55_007942 [Claviceps digitariae]|nr:hypothetical protein E4U55_007942 [Claviceps digitariae]